MKREFPDHPIVGVGGVVVDRNRVLLVLRGGEPLKGQWSIPGGMLELGEELRYGVQRELKEETGLDVEALEVIGVFDRIVRKGRENSAGSQVRYHYIIIDYRCLLRGGKLVAASDVLDARWVAEEDLLQYQLTDHATSVVRRAFQHFEKQKQTEAFRDSPDVDYPLR